MAVVEQLQSTKYSDDLLNYWRKGEIIVPLELPFVARQQKGLLKSFQLIHFQRGQMHREIQPRESKLSVNESIENYDIRLQQAQTTNNNFLLYISCGRLFVEQSLLFDSWSIFSNFFSSRKFSWTLHLPCVFTRATFIPLNNFSIKLWPKFIQM